MPHAVTGIRTGVTLDLAALAPCRRTHLPDVTGRPRSNRSWAVNGQSNPTFFVTVDMRELVLRKRPAGALMPAAAAIDREFREQNALVGSGVPVPHVLMYHADPNLIGIPST